MKTLNITDITLNPAVENMAATGQTIFRLSVYKSNILGYIATDFSVNCVLEIFTVLQYHLPFGVCCGLVCVDLVIIYSIVYFDCDA